MRQFETAAAPNRDADPAVSHLIRAELHAGEALGVALQVRDALIRLSAANAGLSVDTCAA